MMGKTDLNINNAFKTYRQMKMDSVIGGSMSFIKSLVTNSEYSLKPHPKATAKELALTKALNESFDEMVYDRKQLLGNWAQSLDYGCSLNEMTFKPASGGLIVFKNFSPIHLSSVDKFEFEDGSLKIIRLNQAENDGLVFDSRLGTQPEINGNKILFFRIEQDSDFPLGKSLLYSCYTSWKSKNVLQEYELIGVAKNLSGVLNVAVPAEYINKFQSDPNSDEAVYVANLLTQADNLHAGRGSYILRASDTNAQGVPLFDISTVGGNGGNAANFNVGESISRYNREILIALQTSVLSMGSEGGGSFALSDNSTYLLTLFIENIQKAFSSEFKKAVKFAFELNGLSTERLPTLSFEEIQGIDWDSFSKGWQRLLASGGVTATEDLEAFFRAKGNAPAADYTKKLENKTQADASERLETDKQG